MPSGILKWVTPLGILKESIKDAVYNRIAIIPIRFFVLFNIGVAFYYNAGHSIWAEITAWNLTLLLVLGWVYVRAFVKLYLDEFRVSVFV